MITDCPNCSCLLEGEISPGVKIDCPFCETTFLVCATPFEQLKAYLNDVNSDSERSPFFDKNYALPAAYKNFAGWIVHRIRKKQHEDLFRLCCVFMSSIQAKMMLDAILQFDFRRYITISDDAHTELLANWIVSGFCLLDRPTFASTIAEHLWIYPVAVRAEYSDIALQKAQKLHCSNDDFFQKEDLTLEHLRNNPLWEWSIKTPLAIRQRLMLALLYSGHSTENATRRSWIQLDNCTYYDSRMHGVDYGYATKKLLNSNIFCEPPFNDWEKLFSKGEYASILDELNIPIKKSFSRKQMLTEILNYDGGESFIQNKIISRGFVQIHPSLVKYAIDLERHYRKCFRLWEIILSFDFGNTTPINSMLYQNHTMAYRVEHYLKDMKAVNVFPAWRYHCAVDREECLNHQIFNGKVFSKTDPVWEHIFPPNSVNCGCWVENVGKREFANEKRMDLGDMPLIQPNGDYIFNPIEIIEKLKTIPDFPDL